MTDTIHTATADLSDLPDDPNIWCVWTQGTIGGPPTLVRRISDTRYCAILPMMFTHAVVVGFIDDCRMGYDDRWCYHDSFAAIAAATVWSGEPGTEPEGWHRHPRSGRRRDADGNETINP